MRPLPDLPVAEALPRLRAVLADAGRAVLASPPGSGKTTLVPLALLDEPWLAGKRILMLEPRRIAARASAARMAQLLGERVGETVGYQIRFERKVTAATRIEVITEGLLTRRLQSDPELPGVGLVIFDEFHERSLDADLALALTLDVRANLNDSLRVLVMSATLDTARVAQLLDRGGGAGTAQVVESSGQLFPIDVRYVPPRPGTGLDAAVAECALKALAETEGDILAFLPGGREIRGAQRILEARADARVFPLYGDLSSAEQDAALRPAADGRRKVILATNIAQTSLTVEGVRSVVDGGYVRAARFDLGAGANRLDTLRVSRASADQRAGRAGRLGPGVAYRLWSRDQQAQLPAHDTPEILAADLSRFALELAAWGAEPQALALLDAPPKAAWSYARDLLQALGALQEDGRISLHGRELGRLPTAPRLAHMLLAARGEDLAEAAAWVAAVLDERETSTDLEQRVQSFRAGGGEAAAQRRVSEAVRQFLRIVGAGRGDGRAAPVGRLVALAFPERVARRRGEQNAALRAGEAVFLCADGGEARLPQHDALARSEWLAIAHWDPGAQRRIRLAAALDEAALLRDQRQRIVTCDDVHWDARSEAVMAERQRRLGAIVLDSRPLREGAGEAVRAALLQGIAGLGIAVLPWTDGTRQLQARVLSLRCWRPQEDWPDLSDAALAATLEQWLGPHLDGFTRREHLARLDLAAILKERLDYARQQQLARLAPTHVEVPSGSRVAVEYFADGAPPVLAVKLQELFGLTRTPAVDDGRMPLSLHLLSPARRPIQVTRDLAGFWHRTYPEVKKELKGRYPRHPWPDDPLAAPATARAKPRGQ
ncbi:MAG: ATP-dependent helicase HrpB [Nevskia sp.]|nr:ATP-dependent helicase HrpB [Nevskia sp.]